MAYGLKYQGDFDSISEVGYRLEIYEKEYTGLFYNLQMAGVPVVHNWNTDEPKAPIKGSSLTIKYLNKGSQPVDMFYSAADDNFKVIFYQGANILFVGFLVQDDFTEPMLDYTHEVTLSANDNIGLLKDIELDVSGETATLPCIAQGDFISITVPVQNWIYLTNVNFTPGVGVPFTISGHPVSAMNGTFTPTLVNQISPTKFNVKIGVTTGDTIGAPCTVNGTSSITSTNGRLTLANIIHACLVKTNLELNSYFYCNLFEDSHVTSKVFFEQTYIEPDTFISGEKYDNCYNVLDKICRTFNVTFFQAYGRWNFIRWDELRLNTSINAFVYDKDFVLTGTATLPGNFLMGFQQDTYPETGLTKQVLRPYEFVKETFNYQQPKYLLKNYDLLKLGTLLRTYTNFGITYKEYIATDWEDSFGSPVAERFIRVSFDSLGNEINRMIVVRGNSDGVRAVQSKPIDVTAGDKVKFSFQVRTNESRPGPGTFIFAVRLYDGIQNRYVDEVPVNNGNWIPAVGFNYPIPSGDNSNQWHSVDIESSQIPFDGFLYCYLAVLTTTPQGPTKETFYSDIRLELTQFINDSTKIKGHIHKDSQAVTIKNNKDTEIYIDDSPRNPIQGTLFTAFFNGLVQDRTAVWYRNGVTETKKLGRIITNEELQWRSVTRTKLEGSMRGLQQSGVTLSPLTWFKYSELTGLNFLFGNLEIDYKNNRVGCTAWELFNDSDIDVVDDYSFTYIYDTK